MWYKHKPSWLVTACTQPEELSSARFLPRLISYFLIGRGYQELAENCQELTIFVSLKKSFFVCTVLFQVFHKSRNLLMEVVSIL